MTQREPSEARKGTTSAMSTARPKRPNTKRGAVGGLRLGRDHRCLFLSVFTKPGATEFTVIRWDPCSMASVWVRASSALLAMEQAREDGMATRVAAEPTRMPSQAAVGATVTAEVNTMREVLPDMSAPWAALA